MKTAIQLSICFCLIFAQGKAQHDSMNNDFTETYADIEYNYDEMAFPDMEEETIPAFKEITTTEISSISLYPNPAVKYLVLDFVTNTSGPVDLNIYDLHGRLMNTQSFNVLKGKHSYTFELNDFDAGSYLLNLESDTFKETRLFLVRSK